MVNSLTMEAGMLILDEAFSKTRKIMEECHDVKFTPEEYQRFYECVYVLCVQRSSTENSRILHERYIFGLSDCIYSLVLPSLEDKNGVVLLTGIVVKWNSYKIMARWLSRFFDYLDRFYIPRVGALGLPEQAIRVFHNLVNAKLSAKFVAATISLINQDRNGETCNRNLLRNVIEYFDVARTVGGSCYDDFQKALVADAVDYFSHIASNGLQCNSSADYMYKAQMCLNQEDERANHFLDPSSKEKLLQVAKSCLVDQVLPKLAEKQQVESHGTSTDYQDLLSKCAGLNIGDPGLNSERSIS